VVVAVGLLAIADAVGAQTQPADPAAPQVGHHEHRDREAVSEADPSAPPVTDGDRAAAFPHLHDAGHMVHDHAINAFVLVDEFEWRRDASSSSGRVSLDAKGWVGQDVDRVWFRTEGDVAQGTVQGARAHLLYGRAIARWWDVVAGVRQDWRPGATQTWAAVGVQGLAPYFFEVEATAYVGAGGHSHVRLETDYDLLLTNRLILQPTVEVEVVGQHDLDRRVAPGLSSGEVGLRLRYEFRREFAPYVGVIWSRRFFGTAALAAASGRATASRALTVGGRVWF
jgi:copper resistance protein B